MALRKRTIWGEETKDEICRLYLDGYSCNSVSVMTGVPFRTVYKYLTDRGIETRNRGCPFGYKFSAERNKKISEARKGFHHTEESKAKLSAAKRCNYNGLNGYGHTKKSPNGYVLAYCPLHPNSHVDGYVMLHTVIVERELGRYLTKDEVVHHINHIRDDNRPENLVLMDKHEHMSMHMKERHQERRNKA